MTKNVFNAHHSFNAYDDDLIVEAFATVGYSRKVSPWKFWIIALLQYLLFFSVHARLFCDDPTAFGRRITSGQHIAFDDNYVMAIYLRKSYK